MGVDPLRSPPCPLGGKEGKSPTSSGKKNCNISESFKFLGILTESKKCSSALFPPRLPPSKAPLSTGRSWVQFLVMTEWKILFSQKDFNFSGIRPRAICVRLLFFLLDYPLRKHPLSTGRSWDSILIHDRMKKSHFLRKFHLFRTLDRDVIRFIQVRAVLRYIGIDHFRKFPLAPWGEKRKFPPPLPGKTLLYLEKFQFFRLPTESNMCSSALFRSRLPPFESTLVNWEVMSSILSHGRMKKSYFLGKFRVFLH